MEDEDAFHDSRWQSDALDEFDGSPGDILPAGSPDEDDEVETDVMRDGSDQEEGGEEEALQEDEEEEDEPAPAPLKRQKTEPSAAPASGSSNKSATRRVAALTSSRAAWLCLLCAATWIPVRPTYLRLGSICGTHNFPSIV